MKVISAEEANLILRECGLKLGDWGNILPLDATELNNNWVSYQAPKNNLLNFSHYVLDWLNSEEWVIFQIDKSTGWINPVQSSLLGGLLFGSNDFLEFDVNNCHSILFDSQDDTKEQGLTKLMISNLIYFFLLFELHGYIATSCNNHRRYLSIQDGLVYFYSLDNDLEEAKKILNGFESRSSASPDWVLRVIADHQE